MISIHNPVILCIGSVRKPPLQEARSKCWMCLLSSQVHYWRDSSQLRWHWVNRGVKYKAFPDHSAEPSGILTGLLPYSNYKMYIVVANNRFEGPPSNTIQFSTPEGGNQNHISEIMGYPLLPYLKSPSRRRAEIK